MLQVGATGIKKKKKTYIIKFSIFYGYLLVH
jgi:hypothetical protein